MLAFDLLPSTNDFLRDGALFGKFTDRTVVMALEQSAGKGRLGREWKAPSGLGLLFSLLTFSSLPPERYSLLSLLAGLAVRRGIEDLLYDLGADESGLELAWPNDILYKGHKLCGILLESGVDSAGQRFAVIGVGINVNQRESDFPADLRRPATSLYLLTGKVGNPPRLLDTILPAFADFLDRVEQFGSDWIAPEWLLESGLFGKRVSVADGEARIEGEVTGVEPDGALGLRTSEGETRVVRTGDFVWTG